MKKLFLLTIVCIVALLFVQDAVAQDLVDVTFRANTAAWRDTLGADGLVQIRGTVASTDGPDTLSDGVIVDWNAATTMYLTNTEGDYWEGTFAIPKGTLLVYKFFVNARHSSVAPGDDWEHDGWENNVSDGFGDDGVSEGGNRLLDLTDAEDDIVLPLQFVNGIGHGDLGQYEAPFESVEGTFAVWVRVNVAGWEDFNPENHVIGVRGSNQSDWGQTGQISWGETYVLNREGATRFFSNVINVPDEYATANLRYKFVAHFQGRPLDEDWGDMAYNTNVDIDVITAGRDTTIYWVWFDNLKPVQAEHSDTLILTFRADMTRAISERGFSHGDTLEVRAGYDASADRTYVNRMVRLGFTNTYTATDTIVGTLDKPLLYQYYMYKDGADLREVYYDFTYPDKGDPIAERRRITIPTNTYMIVDNATEISDVRRQPRFRNTSRLSRNIAVTYTVDIRPAIFQVIAGDTLRDIQGTLHVSHPDSIFSWGVVINGPATGGWGNWGSALRNDTSRAMTHVGDSVFAITINYTTTDFIGQEFKFGVGGGDNEGGFGNNHIENIDDTEDTYTLHSQFGSIDPLFYNAWDFENQIPVSVEDSPFIPLMYTLEQNYPNPFNPSTSIIYSIPKGADVTLKVYNLLGQLVATLINENQIAGRHEVTFDASNLPSGLYFYQINAGSFTDVKKMILLK